LGVGGAADGSGAFGGSRPDRGGAATGTAETLALALAVGSVAATGVTVGVGVGRDAGAAPGRAERTTAVGGAAGVGLERSIRAMFAMVTRYQSRERSGWYVTNTGRPSRVVSR
jgi:hypothetical protein